jgi:hypothetical protein
MKIRELAELIHTLPPPVQELEISQLVMMRDFFGGAKTAECEHCHKTIAKQVNLNGRNGRADKKYCSAACRAAQYRDKKMAN